MPPALGMWKAIPNQPCVLALAVERLIRTSTFVPQPPELREAFALSSCASQPQGPTEADMRAQLQSEMAAAKQDCAARFPTSPRHNHVAQAQCFNTFTFANLARITPYADIQMMMNARRLAVAEKVDQGTMTEADADSQMAEAVVYARGEENRRNNASAQTQAQIATARAAESQAISAANAPPPVVVAAPPPQCGILMGGRPQC
jgi:hypothetical protein